jgi:nitrate reductase cytochrome c-type subunit
MTSDDWRPGGWPLGILLIGCAAAAIAAVIVAIKRAPARRDAEPELRAVALVAAPAQPIAAEAQVFRTGTGMMAIEPEARRERAAHTRTLKTWRMLRAYSGAPPRIPHGLFPEEHRTGACKACHEHGGYSRRFAAYVPLTPHAERGMCLQCHVGDDELTDISRPSSDPNSRCRLCHSPQGVPRPSINARPDGPTAAWPQLQPTVRDGSPPSIPHELELRGNCLACHAGPAAVAEIRTTHPGQANCRQCHVAQDGEAGLFTRPGGAVVTETGGAP